MYSCSAASFLQRQNIVRLFGLLKGQTAASSYKPAKLNNGLDIMVPPFIEEGNKIILDSRTLEYVKKINWWKSTLHNLI